jgi:hypothetical protein
MAEASLQTELNETKAEVLRLTERLSFGTPSVHKDLSLFTLVPKWSVSEAAAPLEGIINSLELAARIGQWQDTDNFEIAFFKLTDFENVFYQGCA